MCDDSLRDGDCLQESSLSPDPLEDFDPLQETSQVPSDSESLQPMCTAAHLNHIEPNVNQEPLLPSDLREDCTGGLSFTVMESDESVKLSTEKKNPGNSDLDIKSEADEEMLDFDSMVTFYEEHSETECSEIKQEIVDDNLYDNVDTSLNHEIILSTEFEQKFICEEPYYDLESEDVESTLNNVELTTSNKRKQVVTTSPENFSVIKKRKTMSTQQFEQVLPRLPYVSSKQNRPSENTNKIYKTRYFCPECNMHYVSTKVASQHISIFHPELDYLEAIENILSKKIEYLQCDLCPQLICGEVKLREHKQKVHSVTSQLSELESGDVESFSSVDSETTIECNSVLAKPVYQCDFCYCQFESARLLNSHRCSSFSENNQKMAKNNFEYEIIKKPAASFISNDKTVTENTIVNYSKRNSKWKCDHCPQCFNDKYSLRDHIDAKHVNSEHYQNNVNKSKSKICTMRYFCSDCSNHFASKNDAMVHMKYVHYKSDKEISKKKIVCKSTEVWSCIFCPDVYCYDQDLQNHIKMKHASLDKSNSVAEIITSQNSSSDDETDANTNLNCTSDEENDTGGNMVYQCNLCDKYFPGETQLKKHKNLLHNTSTYNLDMSVDMPHEAPPTNRILKTRYHCPKCKRHFAKRSTVTFHIRLSHPEVNHKIVCLKIVAKPTEIWQCTLCKSMNKFVYFQTKACFDKHIKQVHSTKATYKIHENQSNNSLPISEQLENTETLRASNVSVLKKGVKIKQMRYYCLSCDKHFSNRSSCSLHARISHPEMAGQNTCRVVNKEVWQCSYCKKYSNSKYFENKFLLEKHVQTFHLKSKNVQMIRPNKHGKVSSVISTTEWGNKVAQTRYKCLHCMKHFSCHKNVVVHFRWAHSGLNKQVKQMYQQVEQEIWQCTFCNKYSHSKLFESENLLKQHVQNCHSNKNAEKLVHSHKKSLKGKSKLSNSLVKRKENKLKQATIIDTCDWGNEVMHSRYSCSTCSKHFGSISAVKSHTQETHRQVYSADKYKMIDVPLWECKFCKKFSNIKYYENKLLLKKHVKNFHLLIIPVDNSEKNEPVAQYSDKQLNTVLKKSGIKRKRCKTFTINSSKNFKETEPVTTVATCEWGSKIVQKRYYCLHCTKNFSSLAALVGHDRETHSTTHTEVGYKILDKEIWQCKFCKKFSNTQYHENKLLLAEHVKNVHSISISVDGLEEAEEHSVIESMVEHENISSVSSSVIPSKNLNVKTLKLQSPKPATCISECGAKVEQTRYHCVNCDLDFASEGSVLTHNRVSHPEIKSDLEYRTAQKEVWRCTKCSIIKYFDNNSLLEKHIQTFHSNNANLNIRNLPLDTKHKYLDSKNNSTIVTKELSIALESLKYPEPVSSRTSCPWGAKILQTRYQCVNCVKQFASYSSVLSHNQETHSNIKNNSKFKKVEKEIWECKLCTKFSNVKYFDNIFLIQKHVQTFHSKEISVDILKSKDSNVLSTESSELEHSKQKKIGEVISSCPWGNKILQTRFYCLSCPKHYSTQCYMNTHYQSAHPHSKVTNKYKMEEKEIWECTACSKNSNVKYFEKKCMLGKHFQKLHLNQSTNIKNSTKKIKIENINSVTSKTTTEKLKHFSVEHLENGEPSVRTIDTLTKVIKPRFYCLSCDKHFGSSSAVLAHHRVSHPNIKCEFKYEKKNKELWHCTLCKKNSNTKYFLHKSMLTKHIQAFHKAKKPICSKVKRLNQIIQQQKQTKSISVPNEDSRKKKMATVYLCPKCEKPFKCRDKLFSHLEIDHDIYYESKLKICKKRMCMVKCKYCPTYFYYKSSLKKHEIQCQSESNSNFKCNECTEIFDLASELESHILSCHLENELAEEVVPDEHYYLCDVCSELCETKELLAEHMTHSHSDDAVSVISAVDEPSGGDQVPGDFTDTLAAKVAPNSTDPPQAPQDLSSAEVETPAVELPFETPEALNCFLASIQNIDVISFNDHCYTVIGSENQNIEVADSKDSDVPDLTQDINDSNVKLGDRNKSYFCKFCDKKFKHLKRCLKHENSHLNSVTSNSTSKKVKIKNNKERNCETCSLPFVTKKSLKKHSLESLGKAQCTECKKLYGKKQRTEQLKTHEISDPNELAISMIQSAETSLLPLYSMNYTVAFESLHENTIPIVLVHTCTLCKEKFTSQEDFKTHYEYFHNFDVSNFNKILPDTSNLIENYENYDFYKCKLCDSVFTDSKTMYLHTFRHTSITKSCHVCTVCNIKFTSSADVSEHCLHVHYDRQPFKCKICFASFDYHSKLCTHVRHWHLRTMIHCLHCQSDLGKEKYVKKHLPNHIENIKNKCPFCLESFPISDNLHCHIESHVNCDPSSYCEICMNWFYSPSNLDKHIKSMHGNGSFKCDFCSSEFISKTAVSNHITVTHIPSTKPSEFTSLRDLLQNFEYN